MDPDRQNVLVASLLPRPRLRAAGLVDRPLAIAVLLRNKNDAVAGSFLSPCKGEIPRDTDSPLEGDGFELLVPRYESPGFSGALRLISLTFGPLPRVGIKPACAALPQEWWARLRPVLSASDPRKRAGWRWSGAVLFAFFGAATVCFEPDVFRVRLRFKRP